MQNLVPDALESSTFANNDILYSQFADSISKGEMKIPVRFASDFKSEVLFVVLYTLSLYSQIMYGPNLHTLHVRLQIEIPFFRFFCDALVAITGEIFSKHSYRCF